MEWCEPRLLVPGVGSFPELHLPIQPRSKPPGKLPTKREVPYLDQVIKSLWDFHHCFSNVREHLRDTAIYSACIDERSRSKIKCIHDGEPPCRSCFKSKRPECILSGPFETGRRQSNGTKPRESAPPTSAKLNVHRDSSVEPASPKPSINDIAAGKLTKDVVLGLSPQVLLVAVTTFTQKFPELAFNHAPTFSSHVKEDVTVWIKIAATLALCHRFLPVTIKDQIPSEDELAACSRESLQSIQSVTPSISAVQSLLIMSMYEWGAGNGYGAWMHSGMATRMMQSLDVMKPDRGSEVIETEIHNRTFWACFVMDRFIFCGRSQPLALPLDTMTIQLPIGEEDFAFGGVSHAGKPMESTGPFTVDEYYTVLVEGFEIWSKVLDLIISGGRRTPGMSQPENCPWVTGSPWKKLLDSVEEWRSQHSDRLRFPASGVAVHVSLGHGEKFAYVNLLYYVCILFLNREYIPFLPIQLPEPVGPIDPPLLEASAPPGWWHSRAKDLYNAAECITLIHQQLDELNAPLLTPFAAFCSFCAGSMNGYVTSFPQMNLNRSPKSAAHEELNFLHLEKFTALWKMGRGWAQTLKRVQTLRFHVIRDRARFIGKTRSDFVALYESIHDYAGVSPIVRAETELSANGASISQLFDGNESNDSNENAQEMRNNPQPRSSVLGELMPELNPEIFLTGDEIWNQAWPMWGDQQFGTFDEAELQFNYDQDLPTL
ncbi:uncharacterized protein RSE6_02768 [Rhynchosporium secalis]|uniref:Xylanolytic transcriptional activator regulatory domain-containing protein n=1 Tax=Rhynchosporium secalis TaxID=38038 RepID=A0A1E1M129_RHYSE|nr:uncharacterized protein RSE6_02768 [Rhynchosporium secalis]